MMTNEKKERKKRALIRRETKAAVLWQINRFLCFCCFSRSDPMSDFSLFECRKSCAAILHHFITTYINKVSFQLIEVLKHILQCFACARVLSCFKPYSFLCRHALWMRLCEELCRSLTEVIDHSLSSFTLNWVRYSIEINSS